MIANIKYFKSIKYFLKKERDKSKTYIFFIANKTKFDINEFIEYGINFAGAIFPQIIYNNKLYDKGLIVMELNSNMEMEFIKNINEVQFSDDAFSKCKSILCVVEGVSKYNESFLEKLFAQVDLDTNIIGGGAGFLSNDAGGVLFNNEGYYYDCALLVKIKNDISIGVQHGCKVISGPYVATECEYNVLKQIDYKDAIEIYKKAIYDDCQIELTEKNFRKLSQLYPLGIVKYNSEQIVRDPLSMKDGHLQVIGEIKDNAIINILKVDKDSMIDASKQAAKTAIKDESNMVIMFDCVSRVNYLQEDFSEVLNNVTDITNRSTNFGVVTIGEIANNGHRYISFYNYTTVIGAICI